MFFIGPWVPAQFFWPFDLRPYAQTAAAVFGLLGWLDLATKPPSWVKGVAKPTTKK